MLVQVCWSNFLEQDALEKSWSRKQRNFLAIVHKYYETRLIYRSLLDSNCSYWINLYHFYILGGFTVNVSILCSIAEYKN